MASLSAFAPVDMTDWNFANIKNGTITGHSSFKYSIAGADGTHFYQFTGIGLTYDSSFNLTGGTVTGYTILDAGGDTLLSISGFDISANLLKNAINNNDSAGSFENAVFANNDTITGSDGDDTLAGLAGTNTINAGAGNDIIDDSIGVTDRVSGGDGDDTLFLAANPLIGSFDGGAGYDTMVWNMNETFQLNLGSLFKTEQILLLGGPSYNFAASDSFVAAGQTVKIDASNLAGGSKLYFDGSPETDGSYEFVGGAGRDRLWGGDQDDVFWLNRGGNDKVHGGAGTNFYHMGAALTAGDRIDGRLGFDDVFLDGDYSAGLVLSPTTFERVEILVLAPGHSYNITLNDANVFAAGQFTLLALELNPTDTVIFDGSAETDGELTLSDGYGNDTLTAGHLDDSIVSVGGSDILRGGDGNDLFQFDGGSLDATDFVNGGNGTDAVEVQGDYSTAVVFGGGTIKNIETIIADDGGDYNFTESNGNVAAAATLTIDATALTVTSQMIFNGAAELDGSFVFQGGAGDDVFTGGAQADTITGGGGADLLDGGGGDDVLIYGATSESTSRGYDTINGYDALHDKFDVAVAVTGIDTKVTAGALNDATFDADLALAIGAGQLAAGHAVLFAPSSGDHAGQLFLIVDQDATAGYAANGDLLFALTNALHMGSLAATDFV